MGKFDIAIYLLEEAYRHNAEVNVLPATDNMQAHQNVIILRERRELSNAIRLLNTAEKINKHNAVGDYDILRHYYSGPLLTPHGEDNRDSIRELLESLPGEE